VKNDKSFTQDAYKDYHPRKEGNCSILCTRKIVSTKGYRLASSIYWSRRFKSSLLRRFSELTQYHVSPQTLSDLRVWAQQPAHIPKDHLSSSATTPSIGLSSKKQQSSFASAEGVVPTQEYPRRGIFLTTTLLGQYFGPHLHSKVSSCSLPDQRLASTKVLRITKYKE
jgi:hypothetical protein